jgi:hypothetical protein
VEPQPVTETNLKEPQFKEAKHSQATAQEAKSAEAKLMSMSIAMFMAVVAMLGAVTAYRAALAEQVTLRVERRLQQGVILELVRRQELLSKFSSRTRYDNGSNLHMAMSDSAQQEAQRLAAVDLRQAALMKLQAEEEGAYVRSLQPYLRYFNVGVPPDSDLEGPLARQTARWLRDLGFDTEWKAPATSGGLPNIWEKLEEEVKQGHQRILRLAVAVVLFVVALAFLTFAQLSHNVPKRERMLARIGGVLAFAGFGVALWADLASWKNFAVFGICFAALWRLGAPFARRFAARAEGEEIASHQERARLTRPVEDECGEDGEEEPVHPAEVDPALFAGMRLHFAPVAHQFGRFIISMIAVSAVLSALSGFFYSRAAVASSQATSQAMEDQAHLFRLNSALVTEWNRTVGRMATAEDYHLRYEAARQRLQLAKENPALLSEADATNQMQRRKRVLEQFEKSEPQAHELMTGTLGPEQDVNFPWRLVAWKSSHEPAKEVARWSAHNEMSLGYQRVATTFLALLTFFAIALYLLGQALGMGRTRAAFALVMFACGLVGAGVVSGLYVGLADRAIELRPASTECRLPEIPDNNGVELAAEHFARGWVLNESSWDDPGELAKAAKEFGCAAEIRPTFAAANLYFALTTNSANTPQLNEGGFVSLVKKNALHTVYQAEQKAIDVLKQQGFAPTPLLMTDHGFDSYADGLIKADRKKVEAGRQATLIAIDLNRADDLIPRFNLGLVQFAEGHEKEALETYQKAVVMGDPGEEAYVTGDARVIGGAITDLDVFRQYCGGLNDAAYCKRYENTHLPLLKSELVAATWPSTKGRTLANSGIKLTDLRLLGSGGGLGWSGNVENLPPHKPDVEPPDNLAVVWYAFSPDWQAWRVLPAISGTVPPKYYENGPASISYSVLKASQGRICLQSGRYRAEFYVDGDLAESQEIEVQNENLQPVMFPDLNLAICHPASWQHWQPSDPDAVWTRGLVEKGNQRGAFVFSFFDPELEGKEATEDRAVRRAENILHAEGLAPAPATARALNDCTGLRPHVGEIMDGFSDAEGSSIAKAWITKEGLVNVAAVVDKGQEGGGLEKPGPTREDCEILISATTAP